ncbi:N-acetylmuramoyl-L-alanine amidase family protein [Halarsenatibacter silvermanii]|nr:N-acetylmuramoyl-L-alanine amidase family protein [Halarsenatibacter silvermanii]
MLSVLPAGVSAEDFGPEIYYQDDNVTAELEPVMEESSPLVAARQLADIIGAELTWEESLEIVDLERDDFLVRLMMGSGYIQANDSTRLSPLEPKILDGTGYVPLMEVMSSFGYQISREIAGDEIESFQIYRPETELEEIFWAADGRQLVFDMDEITPYRVIETEEEGNITIEIDSAALAPDYVDNASDRNFNIRAREDEEENRVRVTISGPEELPYRRDGGVDELAGNLVVDFLPRLTDISWDEEEGISIKSNDHLPEPELQMLENPRRFVVDIPDMMNSSIDLEIEDNPYIENVRKSQFKNDPPTVRVVFDLKDEAHLSHERVEDEQKFVFQPVSRVESGRVHDLEILEDGFSFITDEDIEPEIFATGNPTRLVVSMFNTDPGENFPEEHYPEGEMISEIHTTIHESNTTRLVAEFEEKVGYNWSSEEIEEGGYLHRIEFADVLEKLDLSEQPGSFGFDIELSSEMSYEVKEYENPRRLAVDIPGLSEGEEEIELPEPKGFVEDIRMGRYDGEEGDTLRIVLELNEFYGYQVMSPEETDRISLALNRDVEDRQENLVVIDPGHGGFDPGAVASSGLEEKEVALAISKYMNELLQEEGYDVIMTRRGDQFLGLYERVEMANNSNASLFVSVHSNAAPRSAVSGLETYYAPGRKADSYDLARQLQSTMAAELPLTDRGVKEDNFTVIRDTEMPSVLLEIGFLSNPDDAELLEQDDFREKAAESAVTGIINYLEGSRNGVE